LLVVNRLPRTSTSPPIPAGTAHENAEDRPASTEAGSAGSSSCASPVPKRRVHGWDDECEWHPPEWRWRDKWLSFLIDCACPEGKIGLLIGTMAWCMAQGSEQCRLLIIVLELDRTGRMPRTNYAYCR
jgi:hypothetical protein